MDLEEDRLQNLTLKIGSGATPRGGENVYKEFGISLIRSQNVYDFEFRIEGLAFIDEEQARDLKNVEVRPNDILLNITGDSIGRCCMAPETALPARVNQHVAVIRTNNRLDPRFLLYFINEPHNKAVLLQRVHGATRRALTKGIIQDYKVHFPKLPLQHHMAEILGSLDDKIECNRRINQTLEQMAMALYKHWFMDFGPFRNGEFIDSELGRIPKGWEVGKVSDLCEFLYGKGLPESMRISGLYPVYGSAGIIGKHNVYLAEAPGIIVGRKGTIGKLHRARLPFFPIDTTYYVKPKAPEYGLNFLFLMLGRLELEKRNADSAVPGLNRNDVYRIQIVKPPKVILEEFNAKVSSMFSQIDSLEAENQTLAQTRDYLLPKLLSWEIEVKETEKIIGNMA